MSHIVCAFSNCDIENYSGLFSPGEANVTPKGSYVSVKYTFVALKGLQSLLQHLEPCLN